MKIPTNLEITKACLDAHGNLSEAEAIVLQTAIDYIRMSVNSEPDIVEPMYRHYKGGFYTRKRNARLSVDPRTMLKEGDTLVVYEDQKGRWHAREESEFKDPFVHSEKGVVPRFVCVREGNVGDLVPPPSELTSAEWRSFAGMDGAKWATEFRSIAFQIHNVVMDEGWLIGWFANAIMAGYDAGLIQGQKERDQTPSPPGFEWLEVPVRVRGGDYVYDGECLLSFPKPGPDLQVRYIVMDQNRRLFIHGEHQLEWLDADPEYKPGLTAGTPVSPALPDPTVDQTPGTPELGNPLPNCQQSLRNQGKPYPRTCQICGLGPCRFMQIQTETYECPVCFSSDPNRYIRCQHAGCPDGRDPRPKRNTPF